MQNLHQLVDIRSWLPGLCSPFSESKQLKLMVLRALLLYSISSHLLKTSSKLCCTKNMVTCNHSNHSNHSNRTKHWGVEAGPSWPLGGRGEGRAALSIPGTIGVPGQAAVRAGPAVHPTAVQGHLRQSCVWWHVQLLLWWNRGKIQNQDMCDHFCIWLNCTIKRT